MRYQCRECGKIYWTVGDCEESSCPDVKCGGQGDIMADDHGVAAELVDGSSFLDSIIPLIIIIVVFWLAWKFFL